MMISLYIYNALMMGLSYLKANNRKKNIIEKSVVIF